MSWCSCAQGSTQLVAPGISQMPNHANNVAISQPKSQQGRDKHPHKSNIHRRHFWFVCEYINLHRALVVGLGKLANRPKADKKELIVTYHHPFQANPKTPGTIVDIESASHRTICHRFAILHTVCTCFEKARHFHDAHSVLVQHQKSTRETKEPHLVFLHIQWDR